MKRQLIVYFLFLTNLVNGQKTEIKNYFLTVKSGFCDASSTQCKKQQVNYLMACEKIGDYFYSIKIYDSALFYYELPSTLNDHSTMFQTDLARDLRNRIIAKAGDMLMDGIGIKKDTASAFWYHYQFPLSNVNMVKLSLKYFNTMEGIFNFGRYDDKKEFYWQFEINPFMISDTATLNIITSKIFDVAVSKKHINLKFIGGDLANEELQALYYQSLYYIRKSIEKYGFKGEIELDVDFGDEHEYLSGIAIPGLRVSFE